MIIFLAGIFGGAGLGFIAGFVLGARAQRQLGLIFKLEAAKARGTSNKMDEFEEPLERKGAEHPMGVVPPTPDEVRAVKSAGGNILQRLSRTIQPR